MLTKCKNNGRDEYFYDYFVLTTLVSAGGEKKDLKHRLHDGWEQREYMNKTITQRHFVSYKSHIKWHEI